MIYLLFINQCNIQSVERNCLNDTYKYVCISEDMLRLKIMVNRNNIKYTYLNLYMVPVR